jgi:membrane protein YqaA with SNARE-associated domain
LGKRTHKWLIQVQSFAGRKWYLALISLLSALDAYLLFVPNEALLIPAVLSQPRLWKRTAFFVTLGSAVGATSFAFFAGYYGEAFIQSVFPGLLNSQSWNRTVHWLQEHGVVGMVFISLGPFPQHPAVAMAGLAHLPLFKLAGSVFLGRILKYGVIAWCVSHSSQISGKFNFLKFARYR